MEQSITEPILKEAYDAFITTSLNYLQAVCENSAIPLEIALVKMERSFEPFLENEEPIPHYLSVKGYVPSYKTFIDKHLAIADNDLSSLEHRLIEILKGYPILEREEVILGVLVYSVLADIIEQQQGFIHNPDIIERAYQKLEAFVTSNRYVYKSRAVFKNLELQVVKLELDNDHCIRFPTEEDRNFYSRDPALTSLEQLNELNEAYFEPLLEVGRNFPIKPNSIDTSLLDEQEEKVLLLLRLYKSGAVALQPLFSYLAGYPQVLSLQVVGWHTQIYGDTKYVIEEADVANLKKLWHKLNKLYSIIDDKVGIAKERFMSSYEQQKPVNRVLDIVIGLESIFSEGPDSLTYKYALRGAVATARNREERLEINEKLKQAYTIRSKVAHGDTDISKEVRKLTSVGGEQELEKFIEYIRQVLARAILECSQWLLHNKDQSIKGFIKEIDQAMLLTEQRPHWQLPVDQ